MNPASARKPKRIAVTVVTLFPKFIESFVEHFGILKKAMKNGLFTLRALDLRPFGVGTRNVVDDHPYGGGVGMVLRPDVLHRAITKARGKLKNAAVVLMTPQGRPLNQKLVRELGRYDRLVLVCGRYEGFDERVRGFADYEISVGDYVLMGGELPALVLTEAVARTVPGILGKFESQEAESFSAGTLEYPHYTKPEIFKVKGARSKVQNLRVPKVLLTGHHGNIAAWREAEAIKRTKKRRPDLLNQPTA